MFNMQRVTELVDRVDAITETMSAIADEQRKGILANRGDQLARMDAVLSGVTANQVQLVALVAALTGSFVEYLVDQERQHDLGIND